MGETGNSAIERFKAISKGIAVLKPGPHVLLIVFQLHVDGFNEESRIFIRNLSCLESISKYGIVVFTKTDIVDKDRTETKRKIESSKELSELLNISSRRFILFDNKIDNQGQVKDLLKIV